MDDKGTPITTMPAISKQPLDLYKLYILVKERGGLVDVSCYTCSSIRKWLFQSHAHDRLSGFCDMSANNIGGGL